MAVQKSVTGQSDFSAGQPNAEIKRSEQDPLHKAGVRQAQNFRILHTNQLEQRPGRQMLFVYDGRVDEFESSPGVNWFLCFGNDGSLDVRDANHLIVASQPAATYAWRETTVRFIVWTQFQIGAAGVDIVMCFTAVKPQIIHFDGATTWTFAPLTFQTDDRGLDLLPFYRISKPGITMLPSALTGAIAITFSDAVLVAAHVGAVFRFGGQRLQITAVLSSTVGTATCIDQLPGQQVITVIDPVSGQRAMFVGDLLTGEVSGCQAIITQIVGLNITVQIVNHVLGGFIRTGGGDGEKVQTSTTGNSIGNVGPATLSPAAISVWDEQVIGDARGWPQSCFFDQNRLGFCDLVSVPSMILWSWIGLFYDFDVGGTGGAVPTPDYAIAEILPTRRRVFYVVPGPEGSEFVFTDHAAYYIPITVTNPLKPGSVEFKLLTSDGCAQIQPKVMQELIVYVNSGLIAVNAILAPGAYYRPYQVRGLAQQHNQLFIDPICIAVPTADYQYDERYFYVLSGDGTIAVARLDVQNGDVKGNIGWLKWNGAGTVDWMSVLHGQVLFSSHYGSVAVCELNDATLYLDATVAMNALPAALAPAAGLGSLWMYAGTSVTVMDQGYRSLGVYDVDATGNLIPQGNAGEDLTRADLVVGQEFIGIIEPFVPAVQPGQDIEQRMRRRRVARFTVYVSNSTGFTVKTLFSEPTTPIGPVFGTPIKERRIPTYNQDEDPTKPPVLRELAYTFRPIGRSHDPRIALYKDTPGPLKIIELGCQVTV